MNNYDYPAGADNEDAPWNEKTKKILVTVSMTISKDVEIEVPEQYDPEYLQEYVEDQVFLPGNWYGYQYDHKVANDLADWFIDDFTVIEND